MAKQIKAIKCPQCSSIKVREIRPDYYKCNSCGTEFFLDNDDININIRNQQTPPAGPLTPNAKKMILGALGGFAFIIFLIVLTNTFGSRSSSVAFTENESWWSTESLFFEAADKTPVYLKVGERSYKNTKDQPSAAMYNAHTGKLISLTELPVNKMESTGSGFRVFDDGTLYFILNKANIFRVNKSSKTIESVTAANYPDQPLLLSGIAKVEFGYNTYGSSSFNIMTNDGKQLYFFPISGQMFSEQDSLYAAASSGIVSTNSRRDTGFIFSYQGIIDYPNEKLLLIKYVRHTAPGFAQAEPRFSWRDAVTFDHKTKTLLTDWQKKEQQIISYEDLTPNRLYFEPKLLAFNHKYILITFKATPAENENTQIQLMDTNGKVLWTKPAPQEEDDRHTSPYIYEGYLVEDGIFITSSPNNFYMDYNGKVLQKFKR